MDIDSRIPNSILKEKAFESVFLLSQLKIPEIKDLNIKPSSKEEEIPFKLHSGFLFDIALLPNPKFLDNLGNGKESWIRQAYRQPELSKTLRKLQEEGKTLKKVKEDTLENLKGFENPKISLEELETLRKRIKILEEENETLMYNVQEREEESETYLKNNRELIVIITGLSDQLLKKEEENENLSEQLLQKGKEVGNQNPFLKSLALSLQRNASNYI